MRGRDRGVAPASLGHDRDGDRPRPARHRPLRAAHRPPACSRTARRSRCPGETDHPPPLDLPDSARNAVVYLALPIRQAGAVEVADSDDRGPLRRAAVRGLRHALGLAAARRTAGRPAAPALPARDRRARRLSCASAWPGSSEVTADRRVVLDEHWIPPSLVCSAAPPLAGLIAELAGMLNQRGEALAARLTAPGTRGRRRGRRFPAAADDQPLAEAAGALGRRRPTSIPRLFTRSSCRWRASSPPSPRRRAGRTPIRPIVMTTCSAASRRWSPICGARCPRCSSRRRSQIPLQERRYGVRVGPIIDRSILRASSFVLTVQADVPTETVAAAVPLAGQDRRGRAYPRTGQRGHAGYRGAAAAGRAAAAAVLCRRARISSSTAPARIGSRCRSSGGFAIHVSGDFPNLRLELWAIRG